MLTETQLLALLDKAEKAFSTSDLASGGKMLPEAADRFLKTAIDVSKILSVARVLPMKSDVRYIDHIAFATRIMQAATEGTPPVSTSKPTTARKTLTAKEILAAVDVTYSSLEDNIEGANFANTLLDLIATRASADIEELGLYSTAVQDPVVDAYLEALNHRGWLTMTNALDGVGEINYASAETLPSVVFKALLKKVPSKYLGDLSKWRFYCSFAMERRYRDELAGRATAAGDRALLEDVPVYYQGIPVVWVPKIATSGANVTDCMFAHPQNLIVGFKRDLDMESERKPRSRLVEYTITARMDTALEEYAAHAIAKNVKIPA